MFDFESLDNGKIGSGQRKLFTLSSMGLFLDGYDLSIITMAILVIPVQLHLNKPEYIFIDISSFVGMIIGAPILGILSDKVGRKKIFGLDLIFFVIFAITSGLSVNFIELFISRLLMGIGIGGDYPISSTMMAEFSPKKSRGKLLISMVGMYWLGAFFSSVANYFLVVYTDFWRYTFIIGGIIAIPVIMLRFKIPESPRWLTYKGRISEARTETKTITGNGNINSLKHTKKSPGFYKMFIFVLAAWFIFDVAAYGIGFYYPVIFSTLGFKNEYKSIAEAGMLIAVGGMIGYVIALPLADRLGRRSLITIGFLIMSVLLIAGSVIKITGIYTVPYFFLFVLFEQWVGAVTLFYPTELFDTSVRSSVQGIATSVSRVGAILGIVLFPLFPIFHSLSIFAGVSVIGLFLCIFIAPETKNNSLEKNTEMYTSSK
jgi:PHS family inorganic phosphate transporter-like MFS transporter/putative MFS transporter